MKKDIIKNLKKEILECEKQRETLKYEKKYSKYTIKGIADYLGVSRQTIYNLKKRGELKWVCVKYLEEKKEKLTDDITGIKKRFFEQSKDYAKSRITSAKNNIIETYKTAYLKLYLGNKNVDKESEAVNSTQEINITEKNEEIVKFCSQKCASGLVYFDAKITQDFKPILEEVYRIIENNHLINKGDLEFDEEIRAKADSLTTTLRNKVMSYAKPIDDKLAKMVIDKHINGLQSAIVDSLRNSRILSKKKRRRLANTRCKSKKFKGRNKMGICLGYG